MPAPTDTTTELEAAQRLRQTIARLYRRLRVTDASADAGLTPARTSALLHVDRRGPLRLSELAEAEGLNPTMLSRMVTDLVDAGLLERSSDPGDRRAAWVRATAAGADLARRMRSERTQAVLNALDRLPASERRSLLEALPALEQLAEQLAEQPLEPLAEGPR
ncbi:MAG TPA: MarR family winged helix-turn-helix transcriptional regulator [Solirubrobacteraceae bacterium]|nr:MarR family winged helix-turn-helix transcriptional regulator [Solirubrobacteraceae bacterium]